MEQSKITMPGAGTDKTKECEARPGPVLVLVQPQLGENIGAAARAMANFGLSRLRIVSPRDGWPNPQALAMAAHGEDIIKHAVIFSSVEEALADIHYVAATTARSRYMAKP